LAREEPIARPTRTDEFEVVAADKGVADDDPTDGGRKKPERKGRGPKPRRRVIIEALHPGHPKETERKRG
jgi:hypothetical protein